MAKCDFPKCSSVAIAGYKEDVAGYVTCWCSTEDHAQISLKVVGKAGRYLTDKELKAIK